MHGELRVGRASASAAAVRDLPIAAIDYRLMLTSSPSCSAAGCGAARSAKGRDVLRFMLGLARKSGALKVDAVTDGEMARTTSAEMIFFEPGRSWCSRPEGRS